MLKKSFSSHTEVNLSSLGPYETSFIRSNFFSSRISARFKHFSIKTEVGLLSLGQDKTGPIRTNLFLVKGWCILCAVECNETKKLIKCINFPKKS